MAQEGHINIREIKELANKFTFEQLEACIEEQIKKGTNLCGLQGDNEYIINELTKAEFIRRRMEQGMSLTDAIRELASKIRAFHELQKS